MLNGNTFIFLGGDERYLHAMNRLKLERATIYTNGFSQAELLVDDSMELDLSLLPFDKADGIVLPVLGTDNEGGIQQYYPKDKISLKVETVNNLKKDCLFFTGVANEYLQGLCENVNRKLIALYEQDHVAIYNSIPTAEATLQIAMEKTNYTIYGATVLVTGFGRIGQTTVQLFQRVGAKVHVCARSKRDLARIDSQQMKAIPFSNLHDAVADVDICINTVPKLVFGESVLTNMHEDALIIDLASAPGGVDFSRAESLKIEAVQALGLPGKHAPKTAGEIIATEIIRHYV